MSGGERYIIETAYGSKLMLNPPLVVVQVEGLAMPDVRVVHSASPHQHGSTWLASMLEPRTIQITLQFLPSCMTRQSLFDLRRRLSEFLNPHLGPFTFRVVLPDGTTRELRDVIYSSGLGLETIGPEPSKLAGAFRLRAMDPVWWDPKQEEDIHAPGIGSTAEFGFPLNEGVADDESDFSAVGIAFGGGSAFSEVTFNITYVGNWPASPELLVLGPVDYPRIENLTTGEELYLENYQVAAGETVSIRTAFGEKQVESDVNGNIVGYLSSGSDLATFHLEPDPVAPGGVNSFRFSGYNTTAATRFTVRWYDRYVAI